MDKYAGIERAAGELYQSAVIVKHRRKRNVVTTAFVRWGIAGLLILSAFGGKWFANPVAVKVSDTVRTVTQYDMLGREDVGAIPAVDQFENSENTD